MTVGVGERRENERRRKFWMMALLLAAFGAGAGFLFGFIHGRADAAGEALSGPAQSMAAMALVVAVAGGAWFSWRFLASADEVEVSDNLWAAVAGLYAYLFGFPLWWALAWLGAASEPVDWILYGAVMLSTVAAYGVRKWRSR